MSTFSEISKSLREHPDVPIVFADNAHTLDFAKELDAQDPLRHLQKEFVRPTKQMIRKAITAEPLTSDENDTGKKGDDVSARSTHVNMSRESSTLNGDSSNLAMYFCGNSLGLQPKAVRRYVETQLDTWASIGVKGHFQTMESELQLEQPNKIRPWQEMAAVCSKQMARLVGAQPDEVVTMNTLTANLHLMMASFYKPTTERYKIIAEWKPFPSDSYALESQIVWHGLDVANTLVELQPDESFYISTESVLTTIDKHAKETALLMLPGIQYYTGQLFDIPRITAYAQSKGIVVGWDLAHAVGNVELQLHDWNVDFAVWCTYKYCNGGPGSIAGAFVNERHGKVEADPDVVSAEKDYDVRTGGFKYRPRLSGWYGGDLSVRFNMAKTFQPTPGAQGFQLSNPSSIDLASLNGALSVFEKTSMQELRSKSLVLTAYTVKLLNNILRDAKEAQATEPPFRIITPLNPAERGAQISVLMRDDDFLDKWTAAMEKADIVMDKRKPNVIRIAPVPMYNTFVEVHTVGRRVTVHGWLKKSADEDGKTSDDDEKKLPGTPKNPDGTDLWEPHEISPPGNRIASGLGFPSDLIREIFDETYETDHDKDPGKGVLVPGLDEIETADDHLVSKMIAHGLGEEVFGSSSRVEGENEKKNEKKNENNGV